MNMKNDGNGGMRKHGNEQIKTFWGCGKWELNKLKHIGHIHLFIQIRQTRPKFKAWLVGCNY